VARGPRSAEGVEAQCFKDHDWLSTFDYVQRNVDMGPVRMFCLLREIILYFGELRKKLLRLLLGQNLWYCKEKAQGCATSSDL
jgi:hypothetical protein